MYPSTMRILLFCSCVLWVTMAFGQSLVLNEVVSKNENGVEDEDGNTSDWIELFNTTSQPIDLGQYALSDDETVPEKWVFPSISLGSSEYLLVFASGKDRRGGAILHTNFRISSGGESIVLSKLNGERVDHVAVPFLGDDEAYARIGDAGANWARTPLPTPRAANIANQLIFSHEEGFYPGPFNLDIQAVSSDTIFFTRNGEYPTPFDEFYAGPLSIESRSDDPNVFSEIVTTASSSELSYQAWQSPPVNIHKGHVLRFASFRSGKRTSPVYTKTYFADGELEERFTTPVISLVLDSNSLFNYDTGIYVTGANFDDSSPLNIEFSGNSFEKGREWERAVNFTYFDLDGKSAVSQAAGIRIHGGKTRQAAQKSFRVYARSAYGASEFEHQFFDDRDHESYKRLVIRTSTGAWGGTSIINDVLANRIAQDLNFESQKSRPVIVYLNGEYWGLYTLMDRIDEHFLSYKTGILQGSIELWDWTQTDYRSLVDFVEENDLSIDVHYQTVLDQIDIDNFIDYNIAQQFFANKDWPANNSIHWKEKPNGKWRWIFYDLDAGFTFPEEDMFEHMMFEPPASGGFDANVFASALYRNLLENEDFVDRYVARFSELLVTTFNKDSTLIKLSKVTEIYDPEISVHAQRWGEPVSQLEWRDLVSTEIAQFLVTRPCTVRDQLMQFFDLDQVGFECTTVLDIDDIVVFPNPTNGNFNLQNKSESNRSLSNVEVYNTIGQLVFTKAGEILMPGGRSQVQLPTLPNGLYILAFEIDGQRIVKRIALSRG